VSTSGYRSPAVRAGEAGVGASGRWFVGTSGWNYDHWKGVLYPPDLRPEGWLGWYAGRFRSVEINYSFYRLPSREVFERWRREVPPDFLFAVKATRYLTHQRKLKDPAQPLHNLLSCAEGLGEKLGPILYQLPPRWRANVERLRAFLEILPKEHRHVFEFRGTTWQTDAVFSLLEAHGCGYCIMSAPALPCRLVRTADFVYLRMHGAGPQFDAGYPDEELAWWIGRLAELRGAGCDTYVYFNNDYKGHAVRNAERFGELLADCGFG